MYLRFPIPLAQHLNAGTVDQLAQSRRRRVRCNRQGEIFLSATYGAEERNTPIQAR